MPTSREGVVGAERLATGSILVHRSKGSLGAARNRFFGS